MVSKAAVIAIVAILAVPILLGYALNVEQVTETDYKTTGDPVNVTQLLQTGIDYTYANADSYQLNTNFTGFNKRILPQYETTTQKTTYPLQSYLFENSHPSWSAPLATWEYRYSFTDYSGTGGYLIGTFKDPNNTTIQTINYLITAYFDKSTMTIDYTYYSSGNNISVGTINVPSTDYVFSLSDSGNFQSNVYVEQYVLTDQAEFADISKGYHFIGSLNYWTIDLPDYTSKAILTIDLNSITADNYTIEIGAGGHVTRGSDMGILYPYYLTKTTTAGVVTWTVTSVRDPTQTWELYYNPDIPHNTYQIYWDWVYDHSGEPYYYPALDMDFHDMYYNSHREFRYIGNWPDAIGEANVYWKVTDDIEYYQSMPMPYELPDYVPANYTDYNFSHFYFYDVTSDQEIRTPTVRVDAALFRAFEYQVIEGRVYDPAAFKTNPATTINDPTVYGPSFTFGGNTYTVTKGNITMGNHDIPVKGLVLSSVPNPNGGYDNKIGNTVISTTAAPSTITFNGRWSASITTSAQEEYQVTKTEWKAGDFAWDGIDHNFIMAGLLASLGAFVGVGIYARRTRSSVWPLLIVCGGAALLFFVML